MRGTATTWGRIAHVFLAVAVCLPLVAAGVLIDVSMAQARTRVDVATLSAIAVAFASVVAWMALLPAVRQVEVSTARFLLGYDDATLPDVQTPRAWVSRARGATWLAILVGLGVVVTVAILTLVPTGLGWVTFPLTGDTRVTWPAGHVSDAGAGWHASWLIGPGLLALAGCGAVILGVARSLVALAPRVLGPTLIERVGIAAERERTLARANALARDLHDQLGHTLTAMTVQVTAARALMPVDPDAADRSLSMVEDLGRRAQVDVDRVVLALRDSASARVEAVSEAVDLVDAARALVDESSLDVDLRVPEHVLVRDGAATALAVLREGLTNAMRHGAGSASVLLQPDGQSLRIEVENPIGAGAAAAPSRAGLTGLRERVLLAGGEIKARPAGGDSWILIATLPIERAAT